MKTESHPDMDLERLFREVIGLTGRLKSARRQLHPKNNLPPGERAVLHVLDAHWPLTASQIARRMGVSRQHVQTVVHRLLARGYVEAIPNPAHLRSPCLQLSASGRSALDSLELEESRLLRAQISGITPEELRAAAELLRRLRKALPSRQPIRAAGMAPTSTQAAAKRRSPPRARPTPEAVRTRQRRLPAATPTSPPALPVESPAEEFPVSLL